MVAGDIEVVFDLPVRRSGAAPVDPGELDAEVERLRFRIVTSLASGNGSADEAVSLLDPHRTAPQGVVLTALLVCTHRRFERCARTLMGRLAGDELLTASQLDELAEPLLWRDRVRFAIPATWLASELDVGPGRRVRSSGFEVVRPREDEQTFPYHQRVPAAAARWAARRLLERGRTGVGAVVERSQEMSGGGGGAVLCGILDAWAALPGEELEPALQEGLVSSLASVRRRGLDVLARTGRRDEAVALAAADGAAVVREWQPPADSHARDPYQPTLLG